MTLGMRLCVVQPHSANLLVLKLALSSEQEKAFMGGNYTGSGKSPFLTFNTVS